MSTEDVSKVTSEKPKNPGRQEWGRKLGKMSKELKLKKQLQEKQLLETTAIEPPMSRPSIRFEYFLVAATILTGIGALYYYRKRNFTTQQQQITESQHDIKKLRFSDF